MTEQAEREAPASASVRSEDPEGALRTVQALMFGEVPEVGARHDGLVDLAHRAAEAGQTNDWILLVLNSACDLWGKYPGTYERWCKLLNLLRLARSTYPNEPGGKGWRPSGASVERAEP